MILVMMRIMIVVLVVLSLALGLPATGAWSEPSTFPDLSGHWARQSVMALVQTGAIQGFPDGTFLPDTPLLLGQLVKMVCLASGQAVPSPTPGPQWAAPYLAKAEELGWLPEGVDSSDAPVSRQLLATIARRAFFPEMILASGLSFPDVSPDSMDPEAVELLHQLGVLQGQPDGLFYPADLLTRAEGCTVLARVMGRDTQTSAVQSPFGLLQVEVTPGRVLQGGHLVVRVSTPSDFASTLLWGGDDIPFSGSLAVIPIAIDDEPGPILLTLLSSSLSSSYRLEATITVAPMAVPTETIELPPEAQETMDDASLLWERKLIEEALSRTSTATLRLPFQMPVNGTIWDTYGALRTYIGWGQGRHWGVDLGGELGEGVHAVLAEMLSSRGNTVVLSHGGGLFTLYCHLVAFNVAVGDQVEKDQVIAAIGSTGASTGPHLHWEARLGTIPVNPLSFLIGGYEN
ncbi:MAG: S-layer homology domain-containing protein [Coprothermobacterota bacterium]|nr:S-layer homology domain-containing protein [Coprothermobacterota bacterium]